MVLPLVGEYDVTHETNWSLREKVIRDLHEIRAARDIELVVLRRVRVVGEVNAPGVYPLDPTMSVADAVAMAKGRTQWADEGKVVLRRGGGGGAGRGCRPPPRDALVGVGHPVRGRDLRPPARLGGPEPERGGGGGVHRGRRARDAADPTVTDSSANEAGRSAAARKIDIRQAISARPFLTLGVPLALVALAVVFILGVRPVYEAAVSVRIDEEKSGLALLEVLSTLGSGGQVFTEMAVLRSRSLAEEVVRSLNLQVSLGAPARTLRSEIFSDLSVDTAAPAAAYAIESVGGGRFRLTGEITRRLDQPAPFDRPRREARDYGEVGVGRPVEVDGARFTLAPGAEAHETIGFSVTSFQGAVQDLMASLAVSRPDREAEVVVVRYTGTDPELVQAVPNTLAAHFLAGRQRVQSATARGTVTFLDKQIDTLAG